jgi:hypothetical protein
MREDHHLAFLSKKFLQQLVQKDLSDEKKKKRRRAVDTYVSLVRLYLTILPEDRINKSSFSSGVFALCSASIVS